MSPVLYYVIVATLAFIVIASGFGFLTRSTGDSWWLGVLMCTASVLVTAAVLGAVALVLYVGHLLTGVPA